MLLSRLFSGSLASMDWVLGTHFLAGPDRDGAAAFRLRAEVGPLMTAEDSGRIAELRSLMENFLKLNSGAFHANHA